MPDGGVLLDVREHDEWAAGRAPHAVHIPMNEVPGRLDEVTAAAGDARVHVVCRSGGRSAQVAAYLNQAGYEAVNVEGGMRDWANAGRVMTSESADPDEQPRVI